MTEAQAREAATATVARKSYAKDPTLAAAAIETLTAALLAQAGA